MSVVIAGQSPHLVVDRPRSPILQALPAPAGPAAATMVTAVAGAIKVEA